MNSTCPTRLLTLALATLLCGCADERRSADAVPQRESIPAAVAAPAAPVEPAAQAAPAAETASKPTAPPATVAAPAANETPTAKEIPAAAAPEAKRVPVLAVAAKSEKALVGPGDWNQWAGSPARNNTPEGKNIPIEWETGDFDSKTGAWQKETSKNIKWVAALGSQTYGNPVVANGKVYVGTNNGYGWLKRYPAAIDLGCLLCFSDKDGSFLWQHSSEKLPSGRVHDWPMQGICAAAYCEGDRVWFVSSRGEVICVDAEGFHDNEDDGPVTGQLAKMFELMKNEDPKLDKVAPLTAGLAAGKVEAGIRDEFAKSGLTLPEDVIVKQTKPGAWTLTVQAGGASRELPVRMEGPKLVGYKVLSAEDKDEADVIWSFDMMGQLGVSQHNMCNSSITAAGDVLFVCTSNGVDESHTNLPASKAPSFIAMDKNTGKVLWTNDAPGPNILHGQWSSPAYGILGGVAQVIFAGGDGWVYSFRADKMAQGEGELLWKFDCNPKESKYSVDGRSTRNHLIATPLIHDGLVFIAVGEDPEHGEGPGHLWCIDPTKRGDVSSELAFSLKDLKTPLPPRRLQAIFPEQGEVARPNPNTAAVWHYTEYDIDGNGKIADFEEKMHRTCGTAAIKNDLLFLPDFSGLVHCLDAKTGKAYWTHDLLAATWGSPLIVEDKVYIGDEEGKITIFKLAKENEVLAEIDMKNSIYSTPVVANNVLYISNKTHLFAIQATE